MIDEACIWDDEEIAQAIQTAQLIEDADPDAARQLRAQAQAARKQLQGSTREPYDPMALYARVLRFYGGGITDRDLETMSYRRFLGYVREAAIIAEDDEKRYRDATRSQGNIVDARQVIDEFPRAQAYDGDVVNLR